VEHVELGVYRDQAAEADADEANQYKVLAEAAEKPLFHWDEIVVEGRVRDLFLKRVGVEIRIADLHVDTGVEFLFVMEFKRYLIHHFH